MHIYILVLFLSSNLAGQIILTEIMYDPIGSERTDEFVEIYNSDAQAVDLAGWQIGDGLSFDPLAAVENNGMLLQPGQYGIIFDANYFSDSSASYIDIIPETALLLKIDGLTFGSGGWSNSTAESVFLVNAAEDTVQTYTISPDNAPGFSDEKINLSGTNAAENWGESLRLNGSPGSKNTLTAREIDLAVSDFRIRTRPVIAGGILNFEFLVKNKGRRQLAQFEWQLFFDENQNLFPESIEVLDQFLVADPIAANDSLRISGEIINIPYGDLHPGISIHADGDEDSSNNVLTLPIFADDPSLTDIIINEIMMDPATGFTEWVELFNAGSESLNMKRLFFADSRDTVQISLADHFMPPGTFRVLSGDSITAEQYTLPLDQLIVISRFPALNNAADQLSILGPSLLIYDEIGYTSDWYGRNVAKGTSLEKINPAFNGMVPANWSASVAASGSTPGRANSIALETLPVENAVTIHPNPFSPDGDGFEDFCVINFRLNVETAFVNIRIFDIRGRLIRFLANGEPVASEGQFLWDGKDEEGRYGRIGAYICFLEALNPERSIATRQKETIILVKQ